MRNNKIKNQLDITPGQCGKKNNGGIWNEFPPRSQPSQVRKYEQGTIVSGPVESIDSDKKPIKRKARWFDSEKHMRVVH